MQKINASEFRRVIKFVFGWNTSRADILRALMVYCRDMYEFSRENGTCKSCAYEVWGAKAEFLDDYLTCRGYWDYEEHKISERAEWVDVPEGFMHECKYVAPINMQKYKQKLEGIREAEDDVTLVDVPRFGRS